jgi:hypothetical protein
MAEMWNEWSRTVSQTFNPATGGANYSWKNDPSMAVQKLMKQVGTMNISHPQVLPIFIWLKVMIDGGLMSLPTCDETVSSCSLGGKATGCCATSRLVPTESGPCYHISVPGETIEMGAASEDAALGVYIKKARNDLNIEVELSGTSSRRVGFPVVTANYFGARYLCGDNWGEKEANVICKSLGFAGGKK